MRQDGRDDFQAWLWGEILLFGLLGSSLALFVTNHELQTKISLPQLGLVLSTVMAFAAGDHRAARRDPLRRRGSPPRSLPLHGLPDLCSDERHICDRTPRRRARASSSRSLVGCRRALARVEPHRRRAVRARPVRSPRARQHGVGRVPRARARVVRAALVGRRPAGNRHAQRHSGTAHRRRLRRRHS